MTYEAGSGDVRFTVKELLDQIRREQHDANLEQIAHLRDLKRDVRELSRRVDKLELEQERRAAVISAGSKAWVGAIAALTIVVNIPAMLYFINGPK